MTSVLCLLEQDNLLSIDFCITLCSEAGKTLKNSRMFKYALNGILYFCIAQEKNKPQLRDT